MPTYSGMTGNTNGIQMQGSINAGFGSYCTVCTVTNSSNSLSLTCTTNNSLTKMNIATEYYYIKIA
jgi:hypothetical protein